MNDDGLPRLPFPSAAEWEEWLENNHADSKGVWIKMAKKSSGIESVHYPDVLESALCFGWDRRTARGAGRALLPSAVHAAAATQPVATDQL